MTDREAFTEFFRGFAVGLSIIGVFILFIAMIGTSDKSPKGKFAVVDKYKGCDVVRYTDRSNSWHYLLDCHDTDRN